MKDMHTLVDVGQVKALTDPLRLRVLEVLCRKPMTTKQIALHLGEPPTKLYHHVETLERVGLIKLVETRQNRGTVEKYYQPVARQFAVDRNLLAITTDGEGGQGAGVTRVFVSALEDTIAEIGEAAGSNLIKPAGGSVSAVLSRGHVRATREQLDELLKKLQEWLDECRATHRRRGGVQYGLTVAFYPVKERAGGAQGVSKQSRGARKNYDAGQSRGAKKRK